MSGHAHFWKTDSFTSSVRERFLIPLKTWSSESILPIIWQDYLFRSIRLLSIWQTNIQFPSIHVWTDLLPSRFRPHEPNRIQPQNAQESEETKFHPGGAIPRDNVLIQTSGKSIPNSEIFDDYDSDKQMQPWIASGTTAVIVYKCSPTDSWNVLYK